MHEPNFIVGPGPDTPVLIGGVLEMIVALAGLGSAVVLYPIVKRQNQSMALGLVGTRTIEGAVIVVGVACLLTVVTLRQAGVGPEGLVTGHALVGLYDRLFLLSQSTLPAFNALLLAPLLYWSRLVPRVLPMVGMIAAPLLLAGTAAVLFGVVERASLLQLVLGIPIALWEFSLGVYLVVKGFKPSPITAGLVATDNRLRLRRTRPSDEPAEEDRAGRGRALPDHLRHLDTGSGPVRPGAERPELRPRPRAGGHADPLRRCSSTCSWRSPARDLRAALNPVVKRQNRGVAFDFVCSRRSGGGHHRDRVVASSS